MTDLRTREALRALYLLPALAQLRHAYWNLTHKDVRAMSVEHQREFAVGLIAPQIRRLEELEAMLSSEHEPICAWCSGTGRRLYRRNPHLEEMGPCDACQPAALLASPAVREDETVALPERKDMT